METTLLDDTFDLTVDNPDPPTPPKRRGRPPGTGTRTRPPKEESIAGPSTVTAPNPLKPAERQLAALLAGPIVQLGMMAAVAAPTTGTILAMRAQATMDALVLYAQDKPKLLAQLKNASKVGPLSEIAQTVGMLIIAIQLDMGSMTPDHMVAQLSGVAEIHVQIVGNMQTAYAGMTPGGPWTPPGDASSSG